MVFCRRNCGKNVFWLSELWEPRRNYGNLHGNCGNLYFLSELWEKMGHVLSELWENIRQNYGKKSSHFFNVIVLKLVHDVTT
jgi:hypothetical protein